MPFATEKTRIQKIHNEYYKKGIDLPCSGVLFSQELHVRFDHALAPAPLGVDVRLATAT